MTLASNPNAATSLLDVSLGYVESSRSSPGGCSARHQRLLQCSIVRPSGIRQCDSSAAASASALSDRSEHRYDRHTMQKAYRWTTLGRVVPRATSALADLYALGQHSIGTPSERAVRRPRPHRRAGTGELFQPGAPEDTGVPPDAQRSFNEARGPVARRNSIARYR
jgi:hypothetical protein